MQLNFVDAEATSSNSSPMTLMTSTPAPSSSSAIDVYGRSALQSVMAFALSPDTTWKHLAGAVAVFVILTALVSYLVSAMMPLLVVGAIAVLAYFFFKR